LVRIKNGEKLTISMIAYLFVPHRDVDILSSVIHNSTKKDKICIYTNESKSEIIV